MKVVRPCIKVAPLANTLGWLISLAALYSLLAMYLDAVVPGEQGAARHPLFFLPRFVRVVMGGSRDGVAAAVTPGASAAAGAGPGIAVGHDRSCLPRHPLDRRPCFEVVYLFNGGIGV
jgi:hypothetical protein